MGVYGARPSFDNYCYSQFPNHFCPPFHCETVAQGRRSHNGGSADFSLTSSATRRLFHSVNSLPCCAETLRTGIRHSREEIILEHFRKRTFSAEPTHGPPQPPACLSICGIATDWLAGCVGWPLAPGGFGEDRHCLCGERHGLDEVRTPKRSYTLHRQKERLCCSPRSTDPLLSPSLRKLSQHATPAQAMADSTKALAFSFKPQAPFLVCRRHLYANKAATHYSHIRCP